MDHWWPRWRLRATRLIIMPRMRRPPRVHRTGAAATWLVAMAAAAAPAWSLDGAGQRAEDRLERTFTLAAGTPLTVHVGAGSVRVTGVPGRSDVRVVVTRQAVSADLLAAAPVSVGESDGRVRLDATPGDAGRDRRLRADVVIDAPPGVVLDDLAIDDGGLELRGLRGSVRATVAHGTIVADDVAGTLRLETTIGPVDVNRAQLTAGGLIRLRTFNGDVRLRFATPPEDARVMALALNGTVTSSLPLRTATAWGPRWGEASIGRADRVVSIDVVTGAIRIEAPVAR